MIETRRRPTVNETLNSIELLTSELIGATTRLAESANLAGESGAAEYRRARALLGKIAIQTCRELKALEHHEHRWGPEDYCEVCGADGRA